MLNIAIKAARAAGAHHQPRLARPRPAEGQHARRPNDFVTEVDQAAEAVIIETLLEAYPGHGILAEESGRTHGAQDSEFVWIIDPLDGTTNFIHGFPVYCGLDRAGASRRGAAGGGLRPDAQRPVLRLARAAAPS